MKVLSKIAICLLFLNSSAIADVTTKFSYENATGAIIRTEERQKISVNGMPLQQNTFKTKFEFSEIARKGDSYHIGVTYRSQHAELVINGQPLDTKTNPQLKAASDDFIGRKLTYVVGPDYRVKNVQGLEELLKSKTRQTFGTGLDESVAKRTFERLLLTRGNIDTPLNKGDGWQISEETQLDADTKFTLKSDVVLTHIDEHQLVFDVSSKGEIAAAGGEEVSIDTPKGTGKIVWNRELNLPSSITLDTVVKITRKSDPESTVTLEIESSSKTVLEPKRPDNAKAEKQ